MILTRFVVSLFVVFSIFAASSPLTSAQEKGSPLPESGFDYGLKAPPKDAIYIDLIRPNPDWLEAQGYSHKQLGLLDLEVFAQALAIAAEMEFGLEVHDRDRGHSWPAEEGRTVGPYEFWVAQENNWTITVEIYQNTDQGRKKKFHFEAKGQPYLQTEVRLKIASELSLKEFPEFLKKEGYTPKPLKKIASDTIPETTNELLSQVHEVALLAGLHQLETQMKTNGVSPEVLFALSQGYARLGQICESLMWPVDKVYKARGLVFAKEFALRYPDDPRGAWLEVYCLSVSGLMNQADTLALKLIKEGKDTPDWIEVVRAYHQYDLNAMEKYCVDHPEDKFARQLRCSLYRVEKGSQKLRVCSEFLELQPDCVSGYQWLTNESNLSMQARMPRLAVSYYASMLPKHLKGFEPFLSSAPKEYIEERVGQLEDGERFALGSQEELIGLLKTDGSLQEQELHSMLIELDAMLACMLYRYIVFLGLPEKGATREYETFVAYHPFSEAFQSDFYLGADRAATTKLINEIDANNFRRYRTWPMLLLTGGRLESKLPTHVDRGEAYYDNLCYWYLTDPGYQYDVLNAGYMLNAYCFKNPFSAVRFTIKLPANEQEEKRLEETRVRLALSQMVSEKYGEYILKRHDYPKAIEHFETVIKNEPTPETYKKLSLCYRLAYDDEQWIDILARILTETADLGLAHTNVQIEIAEEYLKLGRVEEAGDLFRAAAPAYSARALSRLQKFFVMTNNMPGAIDLNRKISERYPQPNHFLPTAAICMDPEYFEEVREEIDVDTFNAYLASPNGRNFESAAVLYFLDRKKECAEIFETLATTSKEDRSDYFHYTLRAALVWNEIGDKARYNAAIEKVNQYLEDWWYAKEPVEIITEVIREKKLPSDDELKTFEEKIAQYSLLVSPQAMYYALGSAMLTSGFEEKGLEYLQKSREYPRYSSYCHFSSYILMKHGIEDVEMKLADPDSRTVKLERLQERMNQFYFQNDFESYIAVCSQALSEYPDDPVMLVNRANVMQRLDDTQAYLRAIEDVRQMFPNAGWLKMKYADALERNGRYREAIAVYESIDDKRAFEKAESMDRLSRIYAAAEDESVRDQDKAIQIYTEMREKYPKERSLADLTAIIYALKGDYIRAGQEMNRFVGKKNPIDDHIARKFVLLYRQKKPYIRESKWWKNEFARYTRNVEDVRD